MAAWPASAWRGGLAALALVALAEAACAHAVAAPPPPPDLPRDVTGVRLGGDARATRIVVEIGAEADTGAAPAKLAHGRLTIGLPALAGPVGTAGRGLGLVRSWRTLGDAPDGALEFTLAPGTRIAHRFRLPPASPGGPDRYVVDLVPGDAAAVAPKLAAAAPAPAAKAARPAETRRRIVVVDAGHGGHDSGALGAAHPEKEVNLAAALALKSRLEATGRYRVVLTRSEDVFVPLEQRVRIARQARADLFLSLHSDSAGPDPGPHGASVYTLSDHGGTRVKEVVRANEWFHNVAARGDPAVGQILLDLTQRSTRNRSAQFASLLVDRLASRVDLLPHSQRDASYFVLLAPDVPAALLEMGFITNPTDEARLADPDDRARMMDAVAQAVDAYFAGEARVAAR
ncbi:MAG: N-acetylmuramoyl-L-alanine amidase [Caulobacteraceae bacterium]|nr:N-acetylmuramoyl-L-alanine amidase [Caulobacteraceae bacterium]